ncbi:MAG: hypothetical protein SVW57_06285 [Thermodesulfobacteriota bacterium]|nr:hypothetical protein [Thermodesulfobacteriota bacterium]
MEHGMFFSFELERCGAQVLSIDIRDEAELTFSFAREKLNSKVEFKGLMFMI